MRMALLLLTAACARIPEGDEPRGPRQQPGTTTWDITGLVDLGPTAALFDRDLHPSAVAAIDAAQTRVRVAQFLVSDAPPVDRVVDALAAAARRGVRVQVLADEEGDDTERVLRSLALDGVDTRLDSRHVMLHNKLILADHVAFVGSHNLTSSALAWNHEASVRVDDAEVVDWYAAWFDALWAEPEVDPRPPTWDRTDLVPLADRDITPAILDCIGGATDAVDLAMYSLLWDERYPGSAVDEVLGALEDAHAAGVPVRVTLDDSDWVRTNRINDDAIARLEAAGIPVWQQQDVLLHAKVLRCDDTVIVSDANWTYSGLEAVHGTSVQATLPEVVAQTVAWLDALREASRRR